MCVEAFKIICNYPQILRYSIAGWSFCQEDVSFGLPKLDSINKILCQYSVYSKANQILQQKFYHRNKHQGSPFCKINEAILTLNKRKTQTNRSDDKKVNMIHKALYLRDNIDRVYVSRKEVGRRLVSIEDSMDASIQELEGDMKKCKEKLIITVNNSIDNVKRNRKTKSRKPKHKNKWYIHNPVSVLENDTYKPLWDFDIQTDHLISARRPDLIIINKKKENLQNCRLCCPGWPLNKTERMWKDG